jgi:GNAT superfamily N-acetyltransferase
MILIGRHSDKWHERRWHFAVCVVIAAVGLFITTLFQGNLVGSILALSVAVIGIASATPLFFSLTSEYLSVGAAAGGLAREDGHAQLGISVLPRSRGQGIGGALLVRCAARARNWGVRVLFMNCLVENAAMMHLARKQGLKIAVSGADAEAFVRLPQADLTSLAAEAVAEHLGLFDHAQKSYWVTLQARLPR